VLAKRKHVTSLPRSVPQADRGWSLESGSGLLMNFFATCVRVQRHCLFHGLLEAPRESFGKELSVDAANITNNITPLVGLALGRRRLNCPDELPLFDCWTSGALYRGLMTNYQHCLLTA